MEKCNVKGELCTIDITSPAFIGNFDPFELSKQSLELLDKNKVNYIFEEYPIGHGVSPDNFKSMLKWMNEKII